MSSENMDKMKFGLSIANLVALVSFAFYVGAWKSEVNSHINDAGIHMNMTTKMELFVPRSELKVTLENMANDLEDIKVMIYSEYGKN